MPSSPGRHALARLAALAALALTLAGCQRGDPEVVPFSIRLVDQAGAPVLPTAELAPLVALEGLATRVGPGELRVADGAGRTVTITFDAAAHPGVAFPTGLGGATVRLAALADPGRTAPGGAPIPYPALRVGLANGVLTEFRLLLVDSPYTDGRELAAKPRPIGLEPTLGDDPGVFPDFPDFSVESSHARFEAGDCGLVYHDVLRVIGDTEEATLKAGERATTVIGDGTDQWTTLHLDSWHRTGSCPDRAKTWTQFAAWR